MLGLPPRPFDGRCADYRCAELLALDFANSVLSVCRVYNIDFAVSAVIVRERGFGFLASISSLLSSSLAAQGRVLCSVLEGGNQSIREPNSVKMCTGLWA